jgi:hypothetical protein
LLIRNNNCILYFLQLMTVNTTVLPALLLCYIKMNPIEPIILLIL